MSIITSVPALNSIIKGVGSTFTLDKTALSINSVVAAIFDGVTVFTEIFSDTLYIESNMYNAVGGSIVSATLI